MLVSCTSSLLLFSRTRTTVVSADKIASSWTMFGGSNDIVESEFAVR